MNDQLHHTLPDAHQPLVPGSDFNDPDRFAADFRHQHTMSADELLALQGRVQEGLIDGRYPRIGRDTTEFEGHVDARAYPGGSDILLIDSSDEEWSRYKPTRDFFDRKYAEATRPKRFGRPRNVSERDVLEMIYDTVDQTSVYDKKAVEEKALRVRKYHVGQIANLDEYMYDGQQPAKMVCRHMALVQAWLGNDVKPEIPQLTGNFTVPTSQEGQLYAHEWTRYDAADGETYFMDPAQHFFGSKSEAIAHFKDAYRKGEDFEIWNYFSPQEYATLLRELRAEKLGEKVTPSMIEQPVPIQRNEPDDMQQRIISPPQPRPREDVHALPVQDVEKAWNLLESHAVHAAAKVLDGKFPMSIESGSSLGCNMDIVAPILDAEKAKAFNLNGEIVAAIVAGETEFYIVRPEPLPGNEKALRGMAQPVSGSTKYQRDTLNPRAALIYPNLELAIISKAELEAGYMLAHADRKDFNVSKQRDNGFIGVEDGQTVVVGRTQQEGWYNGGPIDMRDKDTAMSRKHFSVHVNGSSLEVRDLGSVNGTKLIVAPEGNRNNYFKQ